MTSGQHLGATARSTRQRRQARELALTPVTDPYRGQPQFRVPVTEPVDVMLRATNPPAARPVGQLATPLAGAVPLPRWTGTSRKTPRPATVAGVIGVGLGALLALFGFVLLATVGLENSLGGADRSFYQGSDSSYSLLALINVLLAVGLSMGGIGLINGKVAGRLALTVSGWSVLLLSAFWWHRGPVPLLPAILGLSAASVLILSYQASVTRWLGVLIAPQPE